MTGIIQACACMRRSGVTDLMIKSFMEKYKSHGFAAGCNRELVEKGCAMPGMDVRFVTATCTQGMRPSAKLHLQGTAQNDKRAEKAGFRLIWGQIFSIIPPFCTILVRNRTYTRLWEAVTFF